MRSRGYISGLLSVSLLISATVFGQDLKDPIRLVQGQRVNLQPLFHWWTNATSIVESNKLLSEEEQIELPPRPLQAWVRIISNELTNNGFAWFARAQIQEVPYGPATNQLIVLQHGPFEEKKALDRAVQNYDRTTERLLVTSNQYVAQMERATAWNQKANLYEEMYSIDPGRHINLGRAAVVYRDAATRAQREANAAARRYNQLEDRRIEIYRFTQGRERLTVDTFALRTGGTYQNLPIYDIGLMFGR